MTAVHHVLDVYGVHLHLATNRRDWATLRRKLPFLTEHPNAAGIAHFATWIPPKGGGPSVAHVVFWISPDEIHPDHPGSLIDTCAHEAVHAAGQILTAIGHDIRGDQGTDEPHAYLTGWLTRWLWEHTTPAKGTTR